VKLIMTFCDVFLLTSCLYYELLQSITSKDKPNN